MKFIYALKEEDQRRALYATLVFIMLMILFFLLASMEVPDPPLEEKIVEIEMEFTAGSEGGGAPDEPVEDIPEPQPESAIERDTQEEETVVVPTSKGKSKTTKVETPPKPKTDPKPKVNSDFEFKPGKTTKPGKDGSKFGDKSGVKDGKNGPSEGPGTVNKSRKILSKGKITGQSQEEGKIALDLYVNEFGKVVRTKYNASLSTNGSNYLQELAVKNAKTRKYEAIPGSPVQFVGTVTFSFTKQ